MKYTKTKFTEIDEQWFTKAITKNNGEVLVNSTSTKDFEPNYGPFIYGKITSSDYIHDEYELVYEFDDCYLVTKHFIYRWNNVWWQYSHNTMKLLGLNQTGTVLINKL